MVIFTMANLDYDSQKIKKYISERIDELNVPGISLVIVIENQIDYIVCGYESSKTIAVTPQTCFELGSISKGYTALAILLLEYRGLISLNDPISDYIPSLRLYNENKKNIITDKILIKHLLYHTSGIPATTINLIPLGNANESLKKTISNLDKTICTSYPGEKFNYATINYDILGYLVEAVTGIRYEIFVKKEILDCLDLSNTFLSKKDVKSDVNLSDGYKLAYGHPIKYLAPAYKGNLPAGYLISNAIDMGKWISIQLGSSHLSSEINDCIKKAHEVDKTVELAGRYGYGCGWFVHTHGKIIKHGGSNPNYSGMLIIDKEKRIGICSLSNINSVAAQDIAENTMRIICKKKTKPIKKDFNKKVDEIFSFITMIGLSILLFMIYLINKSNICLGYFLDSLLKPSISLVGAIVIVSFIHNFVISRIFKKFSLKVITVWLPYSVTIGYLLSIVLLLIILEILFNLIFFSPIFFT